MIATLKRIVQKFNFYFPKDRILNYDYFLKDNISAFYKKNGYAIVKNVVSDEAIQIIENTYKKISELKGFHESNGFITSANYKAEIQQFVHQELKKANQLILPKIFNTEKILFNILNILVLKFNKDKKPLFPHQDVTMVDESVASTTFLWIPTTKINENNGALLVLPGSHLWASWQRTHNQHESPIRSKQKSIIKKMIPLYVEKGDLIIFDAALIHASAPNNSTEVRVAMNTGIVSKDHNLIHYMKSTTTPKNKIEKYKIDLDFFENNHFTNPNEVPAKYHPPILEDISCSHQLNSFNLNYLLNKFKNK